MKVRSITYFWDVGSSTHPKRFQQAGAFLAEARSAFEVLGHEVQTTRLATRPFPQVLSARRPAEAVTQAKELEQVARSAGFDYISLGPALPDFPDSYAWVTPILAATENTFLAGTIASAQHGISLPGIRACAAIIQDSSTLEADGFANLRFAALANVPAGSAFFPAAYHDGNADGFALATEAADLAVQAIQGADSLNEARQRLVEAIESCADALTQASQELTQRFGLQFKGIDFSLAPFPEIGRSIGTAAESLGLAAIGLPGSLAAMAFLVEALDRAGFKRTGFSGLLLPVLEDSILAERAAQGRLSITDLLLYSTVCGTGLDTIPLPGNTSKEALTAVLLDLAALAQRLGKPLTARLMPIPGKKAGDPTDFDFAYFANSRVMALDSLPLSGLLAGNETFDLRPRNS